MTLELRLSGPDPAGAEADASALLQELAGVAPDRVAIGPDGEARRDLATGIAIASLVLSLPGAVLATLQVADRVDRRALAARVEALRVRLTETGTEAELFTRDGSSVDLRRDATDAVVDLLLRERGG